MYIKKISIKHCVPFFSTSITFQQQGINLFIARKIPKVIQVIHTVVILVPMLQNVLALQLLYNADKR